jgi:hypothetical protein
MKVHLSLIALLVITLPQPGLVQTAGPSQTGEAPQSRHAAYLQLNRQIYFRHQDPGSGQRNNSAGKSQAAGEQLDKMVSKEIKLALSAPRVSAATITASIANRQGELSLSAYDPQFTNTPFAKFFELDGIETVAVAYVIMQGGDAMPDTQPHLVLYDKSSGEWEEKAAAPTLADFRGCTVSVAQLNPGVPGEAWFLAWGKPFGSSHGTKHVRLYAFDGAAIRTIWQRNSLDGGKITTTPDTVTIDYLDPKDPSIEKHEVFHVSPDGLLPQ